MDDLGEKLRRLLEAFAEPIRPANDGLERIRTRATEPRRPWRQRAMSRLRNLAPHRRSRSGAPGQGGAARNHNDDLGSSTS